MRIVTQVWEELPAAIVLALLFEVVKAVLRHVALRAT